MRLCKPMDPQHTPVRTLPMGWKRASNRADNPRRLKTGGICFLHQQKEETGFANSELLRRRILRFKTDASIRKERIMDTESKVSLL